VLSDNLLLDNSLWSLGDDKSSAGLSSLSESSIRVPDNSSFSELSLKSWSLSALTSSVVLLLELADVSPSSSACQFKSKDLVIKLLLDSWSSLDLSSSKLENLSLHPVARASSDSLDDVLWNSLLDSLSSFVVDWSSSPFLDEDESLSELLDLVFGHDTLWILLASFSQLVDLLDDLSDVFLAMNDSLVLDDLLLDDLLLSWSSLLVLLLKSLDPLVVLSDNVLSVLSDDNSLGNLSSDQSSILSVDWSGDVFIDPDNLLFVDGDVLDDDFLSSWLSSDLFSPLDDFSSPVVNLLVDELLASLVDLVLNDLLNDDLSLLLWSLLELLSELRDLLLDLFLGLLGNNSLRDDLLCWLSVSFSEFSSVLSTSTSFDELLLEGLDLLLDFIRLNVLFDNDLDELGFSKSLLEILRSWLLLESRFKVSDNLVKSSHVLFAVDNSLLFLVLSLGKWCSLGLWSSEIDLLEGISLLDDISVNNTMVLTSFKSLAPWNLLPDLSLWNLGMFPVNVLSDDLLGDSLSDLSHLLGLDDLLGSLVSLLGFFVLSDEDWVLLLALPDLLASMVVLSSLSDVS